MKIDISNLLCGKDKSVVIDCEITWGSNCNIDFTVLDIDDINLYCNGKLFKQNDDIFIELKYEVKLIAPCSRCLERAEQVITSELYDMLCDKNGQAYEDMQNLIEGHDFLVGEYILEDIIINRDSQILCDEDCQGICPKCGVNLNNEECTCERESIDPRLSALKNFFTDKGGVENGSTKEKNVKS